VTGLTLASLSIFPVKSCAGIERESVEVERRGFGLDRRWMVVDEHGTFVTQRRDPKLGRVGVTLEASEFALTAPGLAPLRIPHALAGGDRTRVTVWSSTCDAQVHPEGSEWFSELLGRSARLVHMPDDVERAVDPEYGAPGDIVSFADGYPVLVIGAASLHDLNARLEQPVAMDRFRPSLVVSGAEPFAEDGWHRLRAGDVVLRLVKLCARCVLTTRDPKTGRAAKEPLRTLATYRRKRRGKVCFGVNAVVERGGSLSVGMRLDVE